MLLGLVHAHHALDLIGVVANERVVATLLVAIGFAHDLAFPLPVCFFLMILSVCGCVTPGLNAVTHDGEYRE